MPPFDKLLELPTPALIGVCILMSAQLIAMIWSLIFLLREREATLPV